MKKRIPSEAGGGGFTKQSREIGMGGHFTKRTRCRVGTFAKQKLGAGGDGYVPKRNHHDATGVGRFGTRVQELALLRVFAKRIFGVSPIDRFTKRMSGVA